MWNWSLISCKSTGWSLAKRGRMFFKRSKTPKLKENVYSVMGQWCVQPRCQGGMGPCRCDAVVYVWHLHACRGRTWRGWNHPALLQEELRGRIQRTVQEVEGVGMGRGGWVRHEERVVRSLLNGDGGQRMAKGYLRTGTYTVGCSVIWHVFNMWPFLLILQPSTGLALSSGVCVWVLSQKLNFSSVSQDTEWKSGHENRNSRLTSIKSLAWSDVVPKSLGSHSDLWVMTPLKLPGACGWEKAVKDSF